MKITQIEIKERSDGELFFEIPPSLLEDLGWEEGDDVKFIDNKNGSFTIKKVKYETIELDFDKEELLRYMEFAHEENITFNELCERALKEAVKEVECLELNQDIYI